MTLRADLLDLLRVYDIAPSRRVRLAVDEFIGLVVDEHPDHPPLETDEGEDAGNDDDAGLAVRTIACPHCGEPVVVELELDGGGQEAIHDCSVCCRPIRLTWRVLDGRLDGFQSGAG